MSHPEQSQGQKPEARMNWMTILVIMTIISMVAYFITASVVNKLDASYKAKAEAAAQAAAEQAPAEESETAAAAAPASDEPVDGQAVYSRVCVACHQAEGTGVPGAFPPLANSDWVTGDVERLTKVVLHGLSGPIVVNGEKYNSSMPGWGATLNDQEVAAVATYIRSSFGNSASEVDAATVQQIREATAGRAKPYTADELN